MERSQGFPEGRRVCQTGKSQLDPGGQEKACGKNLQWEKHKVHIREVQFGSYPRRICRVLSGRQCCTPEGNRWL